MSKYKYEFPDGTIELGFCSNSLPPNGKGQHVNIGSNWYRIDGGGWFQISHIRSQLKIIKLIESCNSVKEFMGKTK